MASISLDVHQRDCQSDLGFSVTAWRAFASAQFVDKNAGWVPLSCVVDSGAPFSVIPYSIWHGLALDWTQLGGQLLHQGKVVPRALEWHGLACDLGITRGNLLDPRTHTVHGPFLVVGKFPRGPHQRPDLENLTILGLNFITDNRRCLSLEGTAAGLAGNLSVP